MSSPRRLLHVFPYDPRHLGQTFERWAESQLERWPLASVQLSRYASSSSVEVIGPRHRTYRGGPLAVVENFSPLSGPLWRDWGDDWSGSLSRRIARLGPDDVCVIHLNDYSAARLAQRAAQSCRVVVVFHGLGLGSFDEHLATADRLVVLRVDAAEILVARGAGPHQVAVLPPSVDRSRFFAGKDDVSTEVVRLGFVGRVEHAKGVLEIPNVLSRLAATGIDARVELAGPFSADQGAVLTHAAGRAGVLDRIEFLGELGGAALAQRMREWHLLLLPSYTEGHPLAALEACVSRLRVAAIEGVLPAELERRPAMSVSPRETYAEHVCALLRNGQRPPADDWVRDHAAAAKEWDALLEKLPPWRVRGRPAVSRLSRARRLRPPRRLARAVLRRPS